jgi:predicted phosphodiesterase
MKTLIWLVLTVGFSIQVAGSAIPTFLIKPYLYTIKGQRWALAWSYTADGPERSDVTLIQNNQEITLHGTLENGLFTAVLPLPNCNFGNVSYRVGGQSDLAKIRDIPCPQDQTTARFTFMADTQEGPKFDKVFAKQIVEFDGSAVLIGGDLVQTGDQFDDWVKFFDAFAPVFSTHAMIPVVGNHEYRNTPTVPYWKHFFQTEANDDFYSIDIGPVHVIAINSCFEDDSTMRLKQLGWLKSELEKPAKWKVVFFHHPAFSRSIANNPIAPKKEWKALQQDYIPLFEANHVDLVLNGHTHLYEHSFKEGIHYLTMGPAGGIMGSYGANNKYALESHLKRTIAEIEASQEELRIVTTAIDGKTVSEFTLNKEYSIEGSEGSPE